MHAFAGLFTAFLLCFLAITVYAGDSPINGHDGTACSNKNKGVVNAIGKFCQSKKIYVNGAYASNGMW